MAETLEEEFGIPKNHQLVLTSHKVKGSWGQNETWLYDELDEEGRVVGEYEEKEEGLTYPFKKTFTKLS